MTPEGAGTPGATEAADADRAPGAPPMVGVAVPAAGSGRRMGGRRKPWLELRGEPLLLHALRPFLKDPRVTAVRVALSPEDAADPPTWLLELDPRVATVAGGASRAESVREAVRALPEGPGGVTLVAVHDAARPLVTAGILDRCIAALEADGLDGVVSGWPAVDTLKEVDGERRVVATPDRSRIWHAQTPQLFRAGAFRDACERLEEVVARAAVTDDASLAEAVGLTVRMVEGSPLNLKVTRPQDLPVAELYMDRVERHAG